MKMPDPKMGLVLAALLAAMMAPAHAQPQHRGSESTHEVPDWMNRVCPSEDSLNCWYDGGTHGNTGPVFIRRVPGRAGMVCVFYADHPRRDYCQAGVAGVWGRAR